MTARRRVVFIVVLVLAIGLWYVFRPERAWLDRVVNEPEPANIATVMLAGSFAPRAHHGRGVARVLQLDDGRQVLRLTDFATRDGPDLRVYLMGGEGDPASAGYLALGALKGNVGPQHYVIPPGTDLTRFPLVVVWCRRFGVSFTVARLVPPSVP